MSQEMMYLVLVLSSFVVWSTSAFGVIQHRTTTHAFASFSTNQVDAGNAVNRLLRDYRLLQQALEYQMQRIIKARDESDNDLQGEICLDKKAYHMVLRLMQNQEEQEHNLFTRFAHSNFNNDVPKTSNRKDKQAQTRQLLELARQAEEDLIKDIMELELLQEQKAVDHHYQHDQAAEELEEWYQAEIRRHDKLIKSLKAHVLAQDPIRP